MQEGGGRVSSSLLGLIGGRKELGLSHAFREENQIREITNSQGGRRKLALCPLHPVLYRIIIIIILVKIWENDNLSQVCEGFTISNGGGWSISIASLLGSE